jgi:peptidoglycan biosynthesis protein MviN/MurJ (putative lipid II flippase)
MSTIINRIRFHLKDKDSTHRRVAIGFLWVSAFVFIGKLAGAGKEIIIAWQYGVSSTVDAYVFTLNFVSLPVGIWFSVLGAVLIPLLSQLRQSSHDEVGRFRAELFGTTVFIGLCVSVITYFVLFWFIKSGISGLPKNTANQALTMLPYLSLIIPFGFLISLFSMLLLSLEKHRNTLLESVPALVIIVALLLPPGIIPEPLVWGTVAGFALHMASLALPLYHAHELTKPMFSFRSPAWQSFWVGIGIMAIGQVLMSLTGIIDQLFAAHLDEGSISALNYANRIMALILGLGATAIGRSIFPILSQLVSNPETGHLAHNIAIKWTIFIFLFGILMVIALWPLADLIVKLLFERGAFTNENTRKVALIFQLSLLQLAFYFSFITLYNYFLSIKSYIITALSCLIALIAKIISAYFLIILFDIKGLVISTSIMYLSALFFLIIYLTIKNKPEFISILYKRLSNGLH